MRPVRGVVWWSWLVVVGSGIVVAASAQDRRPGAAGGRARTGPPPRIDRIAVQGGAHPAVRVFFDGDTRPVARRLATGGGRPDRIYLDLPETLPDGPRIVRGEGPVLRVRTAPRPEGGSRVVIEVKPKTSYVMHAGRGGVEVAFQGPAPARPAGPARAAASSGTGRSVARRRRAAGTMLVATATAPAAEAAHVAHAEAPEGLRLDLGGDLPLVAVQPPLARPEIDPTAPEASARPEKASPPGPTATLAAMHGVRFLWPDLEAPCYGGPETDALRRALAAWRDGEEPPARRPVATTPAAEYLGADLDFLRLTARSTGGDGLLTALRGYEQALRRDAEFPDAPRAALMVGFIYVDLGFGPEARAAFRMMAKTHAESPLVGYARLGEAMALRLMRRHDEAHQLLETVRAEAAGDLACQARLEEAEQVRVAGDRGRVAELLRGLVAECPAVLAMPGALLAYADALATRGELAEARGVLEAERAPAGEDEDARLELLAGQLAARAGDEEAARKAFGRVLRSGASEDIKVEVRMHLARLGSAADPAAAVGSLLKLSRGDGSVAQRAAAVGEAADVSARAGRYAAAMELLDRAAEMGPEGEAQADGRRTEVLGRWIAKLAADQDVAGLVAVYAAHGREVQERAAPEDRITVARALVRAGIPAAGAQLLVQRPSEPRPEVDAARAEAELAAGDVGNARVTAARALAAPGVGPQVAAAARAVLARVALASGDAARAAAALEGDGDGAVRAEVARAMAAQPDGGAQATALVEPVIAGELAAPPEALVAAGQAADLAGAAGLAEQAYAAALRGGARGAARVQAGAGLARLALVRGDRKTAEEGLTAAAASSDPAVRRAATAAAQALRLGGEDGDAR